MEGHFSAPTVPIGDVGTKLDGEGGFEKKNHRWSPQLPKSLI